MNYKAIVLDLDGTFLRSDKKVSERNYKAVMNCWHQGMKLIFATARPPRAVRTFLPESLMEIGSFVYYNGAYLSCRHAGLDIHLPIDKKISAELLEYGLTANPDTVISLEVQDQWFGLKPFDPAVVQSAAGEMIIKTLDELKGYNATKILFSGDVDADSLKERFESLVNIIVTDGGMLIQIQNKSASKEIAAAKLCDAFGIGLDRVIAFGDDWNDTGLFQLCGLAVAMGNAPEGVKSFADVITDSNDNDGVASLLEKVLNTGGIYER
ncbi:HAD family hydrolase [Paenibacillus tarimensis]